MQFHKRHLQIGRVLFEDDGFITLEIPKDQGRQLKLEDGDRFLTCVFMKHDPTDNSMVIWTPWEKEEDM